MFPSSFLLPLFSASSGACNRYGKSHYLGNERGGEQHGKFLLLLKTERKYPAVR